MFSFGYQSPSIYLALESLFKIDISQSKKENNSCYAQVWWQNELVGESIYDCPELSNVGLYVAGPYGGAVVDGQVRNFSLTKK